MPAAVVYSTSETNGFYIVGDPRIAQVIEEHKDDILLNPEWMEDHTEISYTAKVMLPPLPAQLSMLNGLTMKSLIRGVMKDLKLTWRSDKLTWWPSQIPFGNVTSAPEDYKGKSHACKSYLVPNLSKMYYVGNWSGGLREILKCCYEHHGLNPESYIQEDPQDSCADSSMFPE